MKRNNKMDTMPTTKLVANVSFPLVLSLFIQALYNIVDSIFVSQISEDALTAVSLAYPGQMLMIAIAVGTGVGLNSTIARNLGVGNQKTASEAASNGIFSILLISFVFTFLGLKATTWFFDLYTNDPIIKSMGIDYLKICMVFCQGLFLSVIAERLLQATGKSNLSMVSLITGAVINIILDPILIFGYFGFPSLGIQGAAIATVIGQMTAMLVAFRLHGLKNEDLTLVIRKFKPNLKLIVEIFKIGIPTMIVQFSSSFMVVGINKILITLSSPGVAFFGIYYKLQNFVLMAAQGLGQGLIPVVGYNYGRLNGKRINEAIQTSLLFSGIISIICTLIFLLFSRELLDLYNVTQPIYEIGVSGLRIMSLIFFPASFSLIVGYIYSAMGNGVVSMISALLRQLVILFPAVLFLSNYFELNGIWFSFWLAELIGFSYSFYCLKKVYKIKISPLIN